MSAGVLRTTALLAATALAACRATAPAPAPAPESAVSEPPARTVRIEETTVGTIDGWKVTVGNVMRDRWRTPDGLEHEGATAQVGLYDAARAERGLATVGAGSVLEIAGRSWTVVEVGDPRVGRNGWIVLRESGPAAAR